MSAFVYLNGTNVDVSRIRLKANGDQGIAMLAQSADGQGAQGQIVFEDPTYDLTVQGWMPVAVDEPDCTTAPRLFTGYVADQAYSRGDHYILSDDRQIDTTINDANSLLFAPVITGTDGNRPSETHAARIAWLLGSTYLGSGTLIYNLGLSNPLGFTADAANYTNQAPADVLTDLVGVSDYIFFVYWDQSAKKLGLFFDAPSATSFTSMLTFSNVLSDVSFANGEPTGTCFPAWDIQMDSDPSEVYCQVDFLYAFGRVVVHSDTTHSTYFSWMPTGMHRGVVRENSIVGKTTTATNAANALLSHSGAEHRTVSFSTRLPAAKVGLLQAGQRVGLRFIHLPGLTSQQFYRVEGLEVAPTEGDPTHYELHVRCTVYGLAGHGGGIGTTPYPHGHSPATFTNHLHSGSGGGVLSVAPQAGQVATYLASGRNTEADHPSYVSGSWGTGWTKQQTGRIDPSMVGYGFVTLWSKTCDGNEGVNVTFTGTAGSLFVWSSGVSFGGSAIQTGATSHTMDCGGTVAPPAGSMVVGGAALGNSWGASAHCVVANSGITVDAAPGFCGSGTGGMVINSSDDNPNLFEGWATEATSVGGTYSVSVPGSEAWAGITYWMTSDNASSPPLPGQWIYGETPTPAPGGGRVTFSTAFPFADGSLRVYVDKVDETAAIASSDGATKTFTLNFDPRSYETLLVDYQGIG